MRSRFINGFRLLKHLAAEVLAQRLRCEKVYASAKRLRELLLNLNELE